RSQQQFADRMMNQVGIHPTWRWLPQTQLYLDISGAVRTGLGNASMKVTSYPLVAVAGIATLLTPKITFNAQAGYTRGWYSSGPSFSAPAIDAFVAYRYSPLGRLGISYDLQYVDSINANYYRDHILRAFVHQSMAPLVLLVQPELHFREYNGITLVAGPPVR